METAVKAKTCDKYDAKGPASTLEQAVLRIDRLPQRRLVEIDADQGRG